VGPKNNSTIAFVQKGFKEEAFWQPKMKRQAGRLNDWRSEHS
jgi:hypothetical protein